VVIDRSKSGGLHGICYYSEDVPTTLARRKMKEWVAAIGHPSTEVFPKHDRMSDITSEGGVRVGSWLNMPYRGGDRSLLYAYKDDPDLRWRGRLTMLEAGQIEFETEHGKRARGVHYLHPGKPIMPDPCDVMRSLVTDSNVLDYSNFEDWATDRL
jgi:hypothetical protein